MCPRVHPFFAAFFLGTALLPLACQPPREPAPPPAVRAAPSWEIQDDLPAFLAFYDRSRGETSEARRARYLREVAPLFPAYWSYAAAGWERRQKSTDRELARELDGFAAIEPAFREAAAGLRGTLDASLARFGEQFPDFDPAVKIRLFHSLGRMDGGTRVVGGQYYLLFGADMIARYHGALDPKPFLSHELFHVYYDRKWHADGRSPHLVESVEGGTDELEERLYESLWNEGLATYMSERLNPGASPASMLLDVPSGLVATCEKNRAFLLADLRSKLDTRDPVPYGEYFLFGSKDPRRPGRAGYYLGYLVARVLAARSSVSDLIALKGPALRARIIEGLDALAAEAPEKAP